MEAQPASSNKNRRKNHNQLKTKDKRHRVGMTSSLIGLAVLCAAGASVWLYSTATTIKTELRAAQELVPRLQTEVLRNDVKSLGNTVRDVQRHTTNARNAANSPVWTVAATLPWIGPNIEATTEVATAADDVATLGATPLVNAIQSLDWASLIPSGGAVNVAGISSMKSAITSAAYAVSSSHDRLEDIETAGLWSQVSEPLSAAREELRSLRGGLSAAATVASLAPPMLAEDSTRHYLLMIQNSAESRASGGIPGALAVLQVENGRLSLGDQVSSGGLDVMIPPLAVDAEQVQIYSSRLGKFVQDVNLTPDFPTAAATAQSMWKSKTGLTVDGVIAVDPIALSYILEATGPVGYADAQLAQLADVGLPRELTSANVVKTLLSDVYSAVEEPALQDAYFAGVAREIFAALSSGRGDAKGMVSAISRGAGEGRVLLWSSRAEEQEQIARYALSGSISGPSVSPGQFGVYFNDGTGAKMDYYMQRTVQLVKECPHDGYAETTVRITSTNTAPYDAADNLPAYVTGAGNFGVPPGSVQTNTVAYGPVQANVETAKIDGQKAEFAPYRHGDRPVGVIAVRLAPGESKTVEFTFGKIVQHSEPNIVVTPTVQPVADVTLPTATASCG